MKLNLNLRDYKQNESDLEWDLPSWGLPLSQGIMHFCTIINNRLFPVGTAFIISKLGIIATASHVVHDAVRKNAEAHKAFINKKSSKNITLNDIKLAVLYHRFLKKDKIEITIWPVENLQIAFPTDVAFGFLRFQQDFPYLAFRLHPAVPRIGDTVFSIGYCESKHPKDGISIDDFKKGSIDWNEALTHRFHVVEAKIKALFVQRFASGYAEGPCFLIDNEIKHGQSGGPVFDANGNICGINLGGASIFLNKPSSLISMIYPAIAANIKLTARLSQNFTINSNQPLINLISTGGLITDGSENQFQLTIEDEGIRVNPLVNKEDSENVFFDFHQYCEKHPLNPLKE